MTSLVTCVHVGLFRGIPEMPCETLQRSCNGTAPRMCSAKLLNKSSVLSHSPARPQILASMQLTPLQLEAILALRSLFLRTTAALNRRRRQLAAVMQVRRLQKCGSCSWHAPCEMHTLSAVLPEP